MKTCGVLVTLSLAIFAVNALTTTEERVRKFFRPEHRIHLSAPSLNTLMEDESAVAKVPQNDESTKCLSVCEPRCDNVKVPAYLWKNESFFQYQVAPINCVLASTVVFDRGHHCKWLCLYLFDCCRACNAKYATCLRKLNYFLGGPEYCYRENYKCMCTCLEKHNPPENYGQFAPVEKP